MPVMYIQHIYGSSAYLTWGDRSNPLFAFKTHTHTHALHAENQTLLERAAQCSVLLLDDSLRDPPVRPQWGMGPKSSNQYAKPQRHLQDLSRKWFKWRHVQVGLHEILKFTFGNIEQIFTRSTFTDKYSNFYFCKGSEYFILHCKRKSRCHSLCFICNSNRPTVRENEETRSVLHCNRFQMVLETKADSEHQK